MSSLGTQAVPGSTRRWGLFGFGGKRAEAAALEERIAILQSQLSECKARAGHREAWIHGVRAVLALKSRSALSNSFMLLYILPRNLSASALSTFVLAYL